MRKIKTIVVSMLAVLMALFCLVGCGTTGKYVATAYKVGSITTTLTESTSYVELKGDNVAVVSIDMKLGKIEGEGTWAKGEEKNTVVITVSGIPYTVTIDGNTMTLDMGFAGSIILEK